MGLFQISELYMGMQRFPCKEGGVGKHPLLPSVDQDNAEHYVPCECLHVEVTRGRARQTRLPTPAPPQRQAP